MICARSDGAAARLTRRVTAESIVLAGAGCAILLQLADPRIAFGVARHSAFGTAPLRRLDGTLAFVIAIVHGDDRDRDAVRRSVEAAHAVVHGTASEPHEGCSALDVAYDANDPDAQRWVAATLYWSAREAHRRAFRPLSAADDELLLRGFAPLGTALRMDAAAWPGSVADFDAWFDAVVARVRVTDAARESYAKLRRASGAPWWVRPAAALAILVALGMLPPRIRRAFEPRWGRRHRFAFELAWAVVVPVYRLLPRALRTLQVPLLLARLRRQSAGLGSAGLGSAAHGSTGRESAAPGWAGQRSRSGYHERHATTTLGEGDDDARGERGDAHEH